ncbi:hypothetical protein [Gemmata sp.]|uniref:hypothetical protein n=1 Tax=Gemmata sp. TaxID=1914242 RepID=UPI003F72105F
MGHNRLGTLPDTRPWRRVVAHIAEGDSAAAVACATSRAAVTGFDRGAGDRGVARVVFLLARAAAAARADAFHTALGGVGVTVPANPGLFDLTAGFAAAVQDWYRTHRDPRTDLAEVAVLAAAETLTALVGDRADGLFPTGDDVRRAVRDLSTQNGFAHLAHEFFARFVRRFLMYHLGRELSQHVGGNNRFADTAAYAAFVTEIDTHCREAAAIVRRFAGEWHKKNKVEAGISEAQARGFTAYCLRKKIAPELFIRGARGG